MSEVRPRKNLNPTIDKMEAEERLIIQKFLLHIKKTLEDHEKRLLKLEAIKEG